MRPQAPAMDTLALAKALACAFAGFARRPFAEKQAFLRKAFRHFVVGSRTIGSVTLSGAYLGELQNSAKVSPPSRLRMSFPNQRLTHTPNSFTCRHTCPRTSKRPGNIVTWSGCRTFGTRPAHRHP